jgi:hypothetical protein
MREAIAMKTSVQRVAIELFAQGSVSKSVRKHIEAELVVFDRSETQVDWLSETLFYRICRGDFAIGLASLERHQIYRDPREAEKSPSHTTTYLS